LFRIISVRSMRSIPGNDDDHFNVPFGSLTSVLPSLGGGHVGEGGGAMHQRQAAALGALLSGAVRGMYCRAARPPEVDPLIEAATSWELVAFGTAFVEFWLTSNRRVFKQGVKRTQRNLKGCVLGVGHNRWQQSHGLCTEKNEEHIELVVRSLAHKQTE
jgi:hypothetical protein